MTGKSRRSLKAEPVDSFAVEREDPSVRPGVLVSVVTVEGLA